MKLTRWNGERWWVDDRPVWRRAVRWFVWSGGWQAHNTGSWTLKQRLGMLGPMSFLGHRLTYYGWGYQWRMKGGFWVWVRHGSNAGYIYWSPDGTPSKATVWVRGGPENSGV